jgi:hypothetical protein
MDFLADGVPSDARKKQLTQLDALVKVGLLRKTSVVVPSATGDHAASRYALTDEGWAASSYRHQSGHICLVYARSAYQGLVDFKRFNAPGAPKDSVFLVRSKEGVSSRDNMSAWAQDPDVFQAFPRIAEGLKGTEISALVIFADGQWRDYRKVVWERKHPDQPGALSPPPIDKAMAEHIAAWKKLARPTREEVVALLKDMHGQGHGQLDLRPTPCLSLPGAANLPVDGVLPASAQSRYRIAISNNKPRTQSDPIRNKTIPYVMELERLQVLQKLPAGAPDTYLGADVYQLTPAYEDKLDTRIQSCFPLGSARVTVIDLQLFEEDGFGIPKSSFQYKIKIDYPDPPAWMNDPALLREWSELRQTLARGRACIGKFDFDRKQRSAVGGGATCRWAFDSLSEHD